MHKAEKIEKEAPDLLAKLTRKPMPEPKLMDRLQKKAFVKTYNLKKRMEGRKLSIHSCRTRLLSKSWCNQS
jgi:hypothetical protein